VAVEKLHFLQNSKNLGDRKCLGKLRKSSVGHPDTILFSRISLERVFQHPRLITPTIHQNSVLFQDQSQAEQEYTSAGFT
jgi:hypothetical protein